MQKCLLPSCSGGFPLDLTLNSNITHICFKPLAAFLILLTKRVRAHVAEEAAAADDDPKLACHPV